MEHGVRQDAASLTVDYNGGSTSSDTSAHMGVDLLDHHHVHGLTPRYYPTPHPRDLTPLSHYSGLSQGQSHSHHQPSRTDSISHTSFERRASSIPIPDQDAHFLTVTNQDTDTYDPNRPRTPSLTSNMSGFQPPPTISPACPNALDSLDKLRQFQADLERKPSIAQNAHHHGRPHEPVDLARMAQTFLKQQQHHGKELQTVGLMLGREKQEETEPGEIPEDSQMSPMDRESLLKHKLLQRQKLGTTHGHEQHRASANGIQPRHDGYESDRQRPPQSPLAERGRPSRDYQKKYMSNGQRHPRTTAPTPGAPQRHAFEKALSPTPASYRPSINRVTENDDVKEDLRPSRTNFVPRRFQGRKTTLNIAPPPPRRARVESTPFRGSRSRSPPRRPSTPFLEPRDLEDSRDSREFRGSRDPRYEQAAHGRGQEDGWRTSLKE